MSCSQLVRYSPQIGLSVEFLIAHICDVAGERVGHGVGDDLLAAVRQADPVLPPGVGAGPLLLLPEVLAAELVPHLVGELVVGLQAGAVGGGVLCCYAGCQTNVSDIQTRYKEGEDCESQNWNNN